MSAMALLEVQDLTKRFGGLTAVNGVSFSAEAHAQSLSWIIYNDLRESGNPLYGSAGATSMLTIIGVVILLTPVLIRTWRDFKGKM